jgi:hypothetical protein
VSGGVVFAALGDLPSVPTTEVGDADWKPIAHYAGISAFGANAFLASVAGDELVGPHDESGSGQEELYVVARGSARFDLDGEEHVLTAPAFVAITDPSVRRSAAAASADAILLAVGRAPGGPFASTWDERHTRDVPRASMR